MRVFAYDLNSGKVSKLCAHWSAYLLSFFYSFAQQNTQTYLANADLLSKCPCNYSSVSHFKFSTPLPAAKAMQLKLSFQGGLVFQFQFVLLPWTLMASLFSLNLKMFCVNDTTYFQGDPSSYIHLQRRNQFSEQNKLYSVFIWILTQLTRVHEEFLLCAFVSALPI